MQVKGIDASGVTGNSALGNSKILQSASTKTPITQISGVQSNNTKNVSAAKVPDGVVLSNGVNETYRDFDTMSSLAREMVAENNAIAQANAERQYKFNAEEAQKNRDFQLYMSNTAHQREILDLQAAGLNPVLSALNGNGAAVTSGATASGGIAQNDTSGTSFLNGLISTLVGSLTSIANAQTSANALISSAGINASASKYMADQSLLGSLASSEASKSNAKTSASASRYNTDVSAQTAKYDTWVNSIMSLIRGAASAAAFKALGSPGRIR